MNNSKYNTMYMEMAVVAAKYSAAVRSQVGALIVKDNNIISTGINGTPSGWTTNVCEITTPDGELITPQYVLHAEKHALLKLSKSQESCMGATLFCTYSPCLMCSIDLYEAGIREIFYLHQYRDLTGVNYLRAYGIPVTQLII